MNGKIPFPAHGPQCRIGYPAEPDLDGGAVVDETGDVLTDTPRFVVELFGTILHQRLAVLDDVVHL